MANHACEACIVTCIDFRFQEYINRWTDENFPPRSFDRVAITGGVKNLDFLISQVEIAKRLHNIKKVVLINHENCGAYGPAGTDERHTEDLKKAAKKINKAFPNLTVETYYLYLDGTFEKIG